MKIGLCQTMVSADRRENLDGMARAVRAAAAAGCRLVLLPEMWNCPYAYENFPVYAEACGGAAWQALRDAARENGVYLVGGTIPEREGDALYNTCFVFDPTGAQIARHRKVHLFDIDIPGGQRFMESASFTPGRDYTLFDTPWGRVGVAICFDIRFAELFRILALEGAKLICVPAAFNMTTGPAHWELSFRMRAVDNQCFLAGCSPARDETASYVDYGHSIVCDPWGSVLGQLDEKPGLLTAELDMTRPDEIRAQLPILKNRRTDLYQLRYQK